MCNVLPVILRANFDDPVDKAQDITDKKMTLFNIPGSQIWKQWFELHVNPEYNKLAETMIIPDSWDEYDKLVQYGIMKNRTHLYIGGYVYSWEIALGRHPGLSPRMTHKGGEAWYRSKERLDNFPYAGYLSRKDWKFNEVISGII